MFDEIDFLGPQLTGVNGASTMNVCRENCLGFERFKKFFSTYYAPNRYSPDKNNTHNFIYNNPNDFKHELRNNNVCAHNKINPVSKFYPPLPRYIQPNIQICTKRD